MQLNFKQLGETGEPLVVMHGLFGNLRNWNWHARELAREFRVFPLDLRNHGDSPHSDSMSYPVMANDILEFLDTQELSSAHLLGHSMGGKVAMQLALAHPDRVNRLLVADIAPVAYDEERGDHENVFNGLLAVDLEGIASRGQAEQELARHVDSPEVRSFLISNLVKQPGDGYRWRFNLSALYQNYDRLREGVGAGSVFEKPTLFIRGALSNYIREEDWEAVQQLFPRARVKTMMGVGHWLHAEKPQVFYKLARDFFASRDDR